MKSIKQKVIILILIIVGICCQHHKIPFRNRNDCNLNIKFISFQHQIYPFIEKDFKMSNILKYFNQNVKIDSGIDSSLASGKTKYYKFSDNKSRVIFVLNDYFKNIYKYDIVVFEIRSKILTKEGNIRLNISRNDFFKNLKTTLTDCDTIVIFDKNSPEYYRFEFTNDTLRYIGLQYVIN